MRHRLSVFVLVGFGVMSSAWASTRYTIEEDLQEDVTVDHHAQKCSENIVAQLEAKFGCKLHAELPTDQLCGAVSIVHGEDGHHVITVTLYDQADPVKTGGGYDILKPALPDAKSVDTELKKIPKSWKGRGLP